MRWILLNGTLLREAVGMRTDDVYQCTNVASCWFHEAKAFSDFTVTFVTDIFDPLRIGSN